MPEERKDSIEKGAGAPQPTPGRQKVAQERQRDEPGGTPDSDATGDTGSFDVETHDSGRRAGRHHGPGEGAD